MKRFTQLFTELDETNRTNEKVAALENAGIKVVERVPCEVRASPQAEEYLKVKKEKLGHLFGGK